MKTLITRLSDDLHKKLKTVTASKGESMQGVVEKLIRDYLAKKKK